MTAAAEGSDRAKRPWWSCRPPFLVVGALWAAVVIAAALPWGQTRRPSHRVCLDNLERLGEIYVSRRATGAPARSGPALFIEYRQDGDIPFGEEETLLCPGDQACIFPSAPEDRKEYDQIDLGKPASWADRTSYAIRDFARFPVQPGAEEDTVIAACGSRTGRNRSHRDGLPVLYADGHTEFLNWEYVGAGVPPADRGSWDPVLVGPGAPNAELAKLIPPPREGN